MCLSHPFLSLPPFPLPPISAPPLQSSYVNVTPSPPSPESLPWMEYCGCSIQSLLLRLVRRLAARPLALRGLAGGGEGGRDFGGGGAGLDGVTSRVGSNHTSNA